MIPPLTATRLRKAAVDNGFDLEDQSVGDWLSFHSTNAPLRIWLRYEAQIEVALSQVGVARELKHYTVESRVPLPAGAVDVLTASDFAGLHYLLRRAFQLSRALPDELLHDFQKQTLGLPRTTEVERLVVQRVGQDIFRRGLIEYWEGRCAITGLNIVTLLRASHSKPWADCEHDAERLDVFNGFLLAIHLDALFDKGYITITDTAAIEFSTTLPESAIVQLGLNHRISASRLTDSHRHYLAWHRTHVFRRGASLANAVETTRHENAKDF